MFLLQMLNWLNGVFCAISNVAHEVPLKSINQGKFTDPFIGFHENMSQIILRLASSAIDCQHVHLVDMTDKWNKVDALMDIYRL